MLELRLTGGPDYYNMHRADYYQPPSEYSTPYADRLFPEFSSEYPAYAYDNPSSSVSSSTVSTRTPARHYTHRRTPSNVSNTSSCGGTNPTFSLEGEVTGDYQQYYTAYSGWNRNSSGKTGSRQNSIDSTGSERPMTLEVGGSGTRLRSSLKRYNYSPRNNTGGSSSSGPGTPTNPTPPDSLTSEDSSYVSAKESSSNSVSRVRFSPITATNLLDLPTHGQTQDVTIPLQARKREPSRSRRPSITDLEREFLS